MHFITYSSITYVCIVNVVNIYEYIYKYIYMHVMAQEECEECL